MNKKDRIITRRNLLTQSSLAIPLTVGLATPLIASCAPTATTALKPKPVFVPILVENGKILYNKKQIIPAGSSEVYFMLRTPRMQFRFLPAMEDLEPTPYVELSNASGGGTLIPAPPSDLDRWWFSTTLIPKPGAYLNFQFRVFSDDLAPFSGITDAKDSNFRILEEGSIGGGGCIVCE